VRGTGDRQRGGTRAFWIHNLNPGRLSCRSAMYDPASQNQPGDRRDPRSAVQGHVVGFARRLTSVGAALSLWAMALLLLSGSLLAATNDPSPWRTSPRLLDSASRRNWEKLGLRWDLFLNYDQGAMLSGGLDAPAHRGSGSVDFIGRADLERLAGLNDLDLLTHFKSTYGRNINPRVGAYRDLRRLPRPLSHLAVARLMRGAGRASPGGEECLWRRIAVVTRS
jgi:hypothetical protein